MIVRIPLLEALSGENLFGEDLSGEIYVGS